MAKAQKQKKKRSTDLPNAKKALSPNSPAATTLCAKSLGLHKKHLPHSIVDVISTLEKAGFPAYIVGGGVRDGLLGLTPKDFDAVTLARPHEIKAIFGGRCRIIGRRFQLAHVYSGRELIEVATFRAPPKDDTHTTDDGMIIRDNVWGTIEEDFARRDFSINALYYQPNKGEILDFCGAIDDIQSRTLRLLGDAKVRIEEDPVRLLRALRFVAKLGFDIDHKLIRQFTAKNWQLLEQVSTHRLYDETQKMFCGGYLTALLPLLFRHGAMPHLMAHAPNAPTALCATIAKNTDIRVSQGLGVNPAFFYAALLWDNYLHALAGFKKRGLPPFEAGQKACAKVLAAQHQKTAIPRFAEEFISDVWQLQVRLCTPKARDVDKLMRHVRFRPAFDFLVMREQAGNHPSEPTNGMGSWWQSFVEADASERATMLDNLAKGNTTTRPKRKPPQKQHTTKKEAELHQLQQLSLRSDKDKKPAPLFVRERPPVPVPTFAHVNYSLEDFLRLLSTDEPYIPSQRYRKRTPSSSLTYKEQMTSMTPVATDTKPAPKKRQKRKANAKPKADSHD